MIHFITGNILDSKAQALVNTVNTVGVMGKGIALQFKKQFPKNYKVYKEACKNKKVAIGQLLVTEEQSLLEGKKIIINFPTKTHWRYPSEYEYISLGLKRLVTVIKEHNIVSIAIAPLGAGNGGLDWNKVKAMIIKVLEPLNCIVYLYQPNNAVKEVLDKEKTKLTPARAMMLSILYELVRNGEFVSEFSAEKVAYFLQRFGAKKHFNLTFQPDFYGPYSGKVKHVLYHLNGSYIMGYSAKDKKPFEELSLLMNTESIVNNYLEKEEHKQLKDIVENTKQFLAGYYAPFGLELLSTVDYIMIHRNKETKKEIVKELENWSNRKRTLFANTQFVDKALNTIHQKLGKA